MLGTAETTVNLDDGFELVRSDGTAYYRLRGPDPGLEISAIRADHRNERNLSLARVLPMATSLLIVDDSTVSRSITIRSRCRPVGMSRSPRRATAATR